MKISDKNTFAEQITIVWSFTRVKNQMSSKRWLELNFLHNYDEENQANTKSNLK